VSELDDDGLQDRQEAVAEENIEDQLEYCSSSASGSEYGKDGQPEASAESEDELVELENDEPDDDEPDVGIMVKSGGKKQKKGLVGRDQIRKIRNHLSSEVTEVEHVGQKRKATQNQGYYSFLRLN
jgi:hypothetical protein